MHCQIPNDTIYELADNTTIVGGISNSEEAKYRREREGLVTWCNENNLPLNVGKIKELIIDFRKRGGKHTSVQINRVDVEGVDSVKFLGLMTTDNLSWPSHIDATVKAAQQHLFHRQLRKFGMAVRTLTNFYRCTIESILSKCMMARYSNCSAQNHKKLQKIACTAQATMQASLPSVDSIHMTRCHGKAANIKDPLHPNNDLLQLLPLGRRYRSLNTRTSRFSNRRTITSFQNRISIDKHDRLRELLHYLASFPNLPIQRTKLYMIFQPAHPRTVEFCIGSMKWCTDKVNGKCFVL
eukprot:g42435.t1